MLRTIKSKITGVILLLAIFTLGLTAGLFLGQSRYFRRRFFGRRRPNEEKILKFITRRYCRKLQLSPAQQKKLEEILRKNRRQIAALAQKFQPEFEKVRNTTNQEIKNILDDKQKVIFEKILRQPPPPQPEPFPRH